MIKFYYKKNPLLITSAIIVVSGKGAMISYRKKNDTTKILNALVKTSHNFFMSSNINALYFINFIQTTIK